MPFRLHARSSVVSLFLLHLLAVTAVGAQTPPLVRLTGYAPTTVADSLATEAPPLTREFRAAWIATVGNIDWPSARGLSTAAQQAELIALLDRAAELRLNAVIFQVRPSADALYESDIEPWSYWLTGQQGKAPEPAYDPLAFAITEAHRRGIELHAWFNPYRARYASEPKTSSRQHISRTHPSLVRTYGPYLWMDPGEEAVRNRTVRVILDVVKRYDVDGVHIDDYFYPYPELTRRRRGRARTEIPFPDAPSYKKYRAAGGRLSREDWRRRNVDLLVERLYKEIKDEKPWVKFGISPFGIWRPGYPTSVWGLDAYAKLYADSKRWLNEGWVDYFTPQLYWRVDAKQQGYVDLLTWWGSENTHERHLWPGNYTNRVSGEGNVYWTASEIVNQVTLTRGRGGATGNVHFSISAFRVDRDSIFEKLASGPYAAPALVPASPWLSPATPVPPIVVAEGTTREGIVLRVSDGDTTEAKRSRAGRKPKSAKGAKDAPADAGDASTPRWWVVRARYANEWRAGVVDAGVSALRIPVEGGYPATVVVIAIDRVGNESRPVVVPLPEPPVGDAPRARRRR
jgi:uncharacterized lipoprotein YddW (UPF0748 family)